MLYLLSIYLSVSYQSRGGEEKMVSLYMKLLLTRFSFRGREDLRITSSSSSVKPSFQSDEKGRGGKGRSVLSRLLSWAKRSKERSKLASVANESSTSTSSGKGKKIGRGGSVNQFLFFGWCCAISGDGLKGNSSPLNLIDDSTKLISSSSSTALVDPGRYVKEVPLNLGIGFGLVYLVGACKNEFTKITELRKEMEVLVNDVKNVISKKDDIGSSKLSEESNVNLNLFATNATEVGTSTNHHHHTAIQSYGSCNHRVAEAEGVIQFEMYSESDSPSREEYDVGVDQLAVELEIELERLQHRLDTEDSFEYQQQEIEMVGENIAHAKVHNAAFVEQDDSQETDCKDYYGVSPRELERRLHELLEEQQQERIRELELALEYTKEKLEEKELEVSWWKDTARLFSQHVSEEETCMSSEVSIIQSRNSRIER